jgi:ribosome recycling factor
MSSDPRIATFIKDAESVLHYLHTEFGKLQTGRANASLVEHIQVDAYGQNMQMKAVAGISIQDARSIVIQPWDRGVLGAIEKAIQASNIGINPVNDGTVIRLNLPPMTTERREQLKKVVHTLCEEARISIRQHRQKTHDAIKDEKDEDVKKTLMDILQKEVDKANEKIEESRKKKEEDVMAI